MGYIAGPNDEPGNGLGDDGDRLHYWGVTPDGRPSLTSEVAMA